MPKLIAISSLGTDMPEKPIVRRFLFKGNLLTANYWLLSLLYRLICFLQERGEKISENGVYATFSWNCTWLNPVRGRIARIEPRSGSMFLAVGFNPRT